MALKNKTNAKNQTPNHRNAFQEQKYQREHYTEQKIKQFQIISQKEQNMSAAQDSRLAGPQSPFVKITAN